MKDIKTRVLVLGGGPGGYVAAIRAGQLGLDTVLVEAGAVGGTCLNVGCIPSKALIEAANQVAQATGRQNAFGLTLRAELDFGRTSAWIETIVGRLTGGVAGLLRKAKVKVINGRGAVVDGKTVDVTTAEGTFRIETEHLVLATGSVPQELPDLPFGEQILTSSDVFRLEAVPDRLVVVGAGYIGVELGAALAKLGARVALVEATGCILPAWDAELSGPVAKRLAELGVEIHLDARARELDATGLTIATASGETKLLPTEKVLVAVGRRPLTSEAGIDGLGLDRAGPFLAVDGRCQTSMRNVWAVGDITGEPMLAHRAMAQGRVVAEAIAGHKVAFDPAAIPAVCYADPEVVSVGLLPQEAGVADGRAVARSFPFIANGRAMTLDDTSGFVRVVAGAEDHVVLGLQAVGPHVSEFASAFALALEMGATLEDLALTVHAHPTLGEAIGEVALSALGEPLHI